MRSAGTSLRVFLFWKVTVSSDIQRESQRLPDQHGDGVGCGYSFCRCCWHLVQIPSFLLLKSIPVQIPLASPFISLLKDFLWPLGALVPAVVVGQMCRGIHVLGAGCSSE